MEKFRDIQDFKEDEVFWPGTVIRFMNVGMNVQNAEEDYYDYMLINLPWDSTHLLLAQTSARLCLVLNNLKTVSSQY